MKILKSVGYGVLAAHTEATAERRFKKDPDNYDVSKGIGQAAEFGTYAAYFFASGYLVAEHGWKGLTLLLIPPISKTLSFVYDAVRYAKQDRVEREAEWKRIDVLEERFSRKRQDSPDPLPSTIDDNFV